MAAGIQADVDAVFPNLDCLTSETTGCNSIQDGVRFKSWVPILLWENGSSRNKQDYRGVSLKDEHVCRVRCHVVFVLTSNDVEMESVLTWRFRLSLPKFSKPSLKGWRPMLEEQGWSSLWVHCWLQGQPQNHQDPPGQFFNKLSLLHFFVGSRAALCLVRWRAGHLRFPQLFARVPVPLSFGLRNCHTESSNKCEPYDFAVNGQGGVVEVILTFLESVGYFWCAIYLRFVLSFIPSLWALEYHWISLLFVTTAGSIGLLCPYVRLALEPGHAFDTFHVWDSMGVSDAKRYGFRFSCQQNLVSLTLSKSLCRFDLHTLFAPVKNAIVSSQKATGCTAKILCVNVSFSLKRFVSEIEMSKFMRFLPAKIECSYKQAKTTTDHRR